MRQEQALEILKTGESVFLTGEPGSGKTHTTNLYIEYLREHGVAVAVTASTGIAATHLGGMTIHSWSGIGIKKALEKRDLKLMASRGWLRRRVNKAKVLIIDEISMLDATTVDMIDVALKGLRENPRPFGGMQVVFVGDFFQLPPVTRGEDDRAVFAFDASAWQEMDPFVCYLGEQHRQSEDEFLMLLNNLRRGEKGVREREILESKMGKLKEGDVLTKLYSHNRDVDAINEHYLKKIDGVDFGFEMGADGPGPLVEQLVRGCMSPEVLVLKKGAKVMFTKNNFEVGFVNGTLGEVVGFGEEDQPIVEIKSGRKIQVEVMEWTVEEGEKILASVSQLPLRLAWAITVHKSQGMSLDEAEMDLSRAFEYGQGYVALSRVRSLAGLYLHGFNQIAMEVHPEILGKDSEFRKLSDKTARVFESMGEERLAARHKEFIRRSGGRIKRKKAKRQRSSRVRTTLDETLELFEKGLSVVAISKKRGVHRRTVMSHLERLVADGRASKVKIKKLVPKRFAGELSIIQKEFARLGVERLKPVFEKFGGKYDYDLLRLARMLM